MQLENRTILILSPQSWGKMLISKHHYAIELSKKNNKVYFLNPPDYGQREFVTYNRVLANLIVITYRPLIPYFTRFHFRKVYNFLHRFEVKILLREIKLSIDILWVFDLNLYEDFKIFRAGKIILHVVDMVSTQRQIELGNQADLILCVSETILAKYQEINKPKFFINHGLASEFLVVAQQPFLPNKRPTKIRIGYVGNLLNSTINHSLLLRLVKSNANIEFCFVGPITSEQNNLGGNQGKSFVLQLQAEPNVNLVGVLVAEDLAKFMSAIDVFLLCYIKKEGQYDLSNSHKLLEYLSTGKVVVSNFINHYSRFKDLINMPEEDSDDSYVTKFAETIEHLEDYNTLALQLRRKELAMTNSYTNHIKQIENIMRMENIEYR